MNDKDHEEDEMKVVYNEEMQAGNTHETKLQDVFLICQNSGI